MSDDTIRHEDVRVISRSCLCTNVHRAGRALSRRFDEAFRPLELTNWQYTLMVALFRRDPPTIGIIARELAIDRTTITANLKPLERRGIVVVTPDAEDGRVRRLALSEEGLHLLQQAYVVWKRVQASVEGDLHLKSLEGFLDDLRAVTRV